MIIKPVNFELQLNEDAVMSHKSYGVREDFKQITKFTDVNKLVSKEPHTNCI